MTVSELIEILQEIENPEKVRLLVNDTAAGYRDIDQVEDRSGTGVQFIIQTKKPKG